MLLSFQKPGYAMGSILLGKKALCEEKKTPKEINTIPSVTKGWAFSTGIKRTFMGASPLAVTVLNALICGLRSLL